MSKPGRLRVGLIGDAPELPVIALALSGADHQVWAISLQSDSERTESMLPGVPQKTNQEIVTESELVVLVPKATADLTEMVESLDWRPGQIVMHTKLDAGISELESASIRGAIPIVVSPVIGFTGTSLDLSRLRDGYAAITSPTGALPIAQALAIEIGLEPFVIDEENRGQFADAVSAVTDFSRAIIDQSSFRLTQIGVKQPGLVLSQLAQTAVADAIRQTADGANDPIAGWERFGLENASDD